MTNGQLTSVLIVAVLALLAIGAIGTIVLRRGRARRREPPGPGGQPAAVAHNARAAAAAEASRRIVPAAPAREDEPLAQQSARLEAMHTLQVVAFGTAIGAVAAAALQEQSVMAIRLTLASIADKPNYAPRRPMLLPKLMQAMNDNDVSRRELSRIIATDPALAGNLLRLANSPFYRIRQEPVESLDRAIALLGLEGMRSLISAALLQPVFRINGGMFAQFGEVTWEHTLYAASAAEAHAAVLENSDPFAAQLLALVMGLATIVTFRVATDEFLSRGLSPQAGVLAALIDSETVRVARHIAASWGLSDRIDAALANQSASAGAPYSSLGRSLQAGRFLGALALLRARNILSEAEVEAALKTAAASAGAYERIWARLRAAS